MAKKIRFPLEMENGVAVRNMVELREHFSLAKVLEYFENGKLVVWLRDHYENDIADAVEALGKDEQDLARKLSEIFDIPYDENAEEELERAAERAERLKRLKEYTDEERFWDKVDNVAFEQDELYDLLDEDAETIYLCGERFSIPLSKSGVQYIGVNNPTVVVDSKVLVDWEKKGISLEGVVFDDKYQKIVNENSQEFIEEEDEEIRKLEILKEYGIDEWKLGMVAFNQDELNDLLGNYENSIYLYGEHFSISLDMIDQEYINHNKRTLVPLEVDEYDLYESRSRINFEGINNPTITIDSDLYDFCEKNISFEGVKFSDDNFRKANLVKNAFYEYYGSFGKWRWKEEEKNRPSIYEVFKSTAFDQADLSTLVHNGVNPIYLTGNGPFYISADKKNMKYIGRNCSDEDNPNVIIDSTGYVNLPEKGIVLEEVNIDGMEYDSELEELEYMEFVEAYEERFAGAGEGDADKAYTDYKNFMKNYQKTHPQDDITSEESYEMFFNSYSSDKNSQSILPTAGLVGAAATAGLREALLFLQKKVP